MNKALVIGSTGGNNGARTNLAPGVEQSVARMKAILRLYGFEVATCSNAQATRHGILRAMEALGREAMPGDAIAIYYTGHGGKVANYWEYDISPHESGIDSLKIPPYLQPRFYQFLVPLDIDASTDEDFRGILDIELARYLARLTAITPNVTLMVDCCYSEGIFRQATRTAVTPPNDLPIREWCRYRWVSSHLRRLRSEWCSADALDPESNRHAVKLMAATAEQQAWSRNGHGEMTEALASVLAECHGQKVSWHAVHERIAATITRRRRYQTPQLDGPGHRVLFRLDEHPAPAATALGYEGDLPYLQGGSLTGVRCGDRFAVMPMTASSADAATALDIATVVKPVKPDRVQVSLEKHGKLPPATRSIVVSYPLEGMRAFPLDAQPDPAALCRALAESPSTLNLPLCVTWGVVEGGAPVERSTLAVAGPGGTSRQEGVVAAGQRVYLRLLSTARYEKTYWNVLAMDGNGAVSLCTRSARSGLALYGGEPYYLGARPHDALRGIPVTTAPGGLHMFLILVSDLPLDLRALETAMPVEEVAPAPFLGAVAEKESVYRAGELRHAVCTLVLRVAAPTL